MSDTQVEITVNDGPAIRALKNIQNQVDTFSKSFNDQIKGSSTIFQNFSTVMLGQLAADGIKGALNLAADAAKGLFNTFIIDGVQAAQAYEESLLGVNVALAASGQYTAKASKELEVFASKIQETTKYSDDQVLAAARTIETLGKLNGAELIRATNAAIQLAAARNLDLATASELVAKASEGVTQGLRRQGIVISDNIPAANKFEALLKLIERDFGDTAQKNASSYSAEIAKLTHQFEDVQKQIGFVITKNPALRGAIEAAKKVFKDWTGEIEGSQVVLSGLVTNGVLKFIEALGPAITFVDRLGRLGTFVFNIFAAGFSTILTLGGELTGTLLTPIEKVVSVIESAMGDRTPSAIKKTRLALDAVNATTAEFAGDVVQNWDNISKAFNEKSFLEQASNEVKKFARLTKEETAKIVSEVGQAEVPTNNANVDKKLEAVRESERKALEIGNEARTLREQAALEDEQRELTLQQARGDMRTADLESLFAFEQKKIEITYQAELDKANKIVEPLERKAAIEKADANRSLALAKATTKSKLDLQALDLKQQNDFLNTAATLSNAKNKELAAIGKAAAITQIAIKTPPAIASSFEFGTKLGGPPLGFVFGAIAAAAMASQAASIAGVKFAAGGLVDSNSQNGDYISARLNGGEMVLTKQMQANLLSMATTGGGTSGDLISAINSLGDRIERMNIVVQANGREIARLIKDETRAGFSFS